MLADLIWFPKEKTCFNVKIKLFNEKFIHNPIWILAKKNNQGTQSKAQKSEINIYPSDLKPE